VLGVRTRVVVVIGVVLFASACSGTDAPRLAEPIAVDAGSPDRATTTSSMAPAPTAEAERTPERPAPARSGNEPGGNRPVAESVSEPGLDTERTADGFGYGALDPASLVDVAVGVEVDDRPMPPESGGQSEASEEPEFVGSAETVGGAGPGVEPSGLSVGDSGDGVRQLQRELNLAGFTTSGIDGEFGPLTRDSVAALQRAEGLSETGIADDATRRHLAVRVGQIWDLRPERAVVDLSEQHVYLYDSGGNTIARWPVSTGKSGKETPVGTFQVTTRARVGTSGTDSRVHMDYFTRFNRGVGFHGIPWRSSRSNRIATPLGVRGASAGCVRMLDEHAQVLFEHLPPGASVVVQT
jgi:hypothetical protein